VAWSGLAFSQATNCLKSLTSAGTAVPTKTQNSNRASWLTGTKSLAAAGQKGGILIGIWDEQELAAIRQRTAREPRRNRRHEHSCNDGERAFKKVSRCSLQQTKAAFVLLGVTTSGEEP